MISVVSSPLIQSYVVYETDLLYLAKAYIIRNRDLHLQLVIYPMYLIIASFLLTNQILVTAQGYDYDQPPPGVPPKAYPNPTSQGKIILTI